MTRRLAPLLLPVLLSFLLPLLAAPPGVAAQSEEVELLFERGNRHLAAGMQARGRRRSRELEAALDAYTACLRLGARTRNLLFNLALTLGELGRAREAFNAWSDYLRMDGLEPSERELAEGRQDALRPRVAVLRVESDPPGAEVRLGRRDLPPRGLTPVEIAVEPSEPQRVLLEGTAHQPAVLEGRAALGQRTVLRRALTPRPVQLRVRTPDGGRLTLDGDPIEPDETVLVPPGDHLLRLEASGRPPREMPLMLGVGAEPRVVTLRPGVVPQAAVTLRAERDVQVFVDGLRVGAGTEVNLPLLPGRSHMLRAEVDDRPPVTREVRLDPGAQLVLDVRFGDPPDATAIEIARAAVALASLTFLGLGIGLAAEAQSRRDRYFELESRFVEGGSVDQELREELFRVRAGYGRIQPWVDTAFGLGFAAGIAAMVLPFVHPGGGDPGSLEVAAGPRAGGAELTFRGSW